MAVTKIWSVGGDGLKASIDYATNEKKTVYAPAELQSLQDIMDFVGQDRAREELSAALGYAIQPGKTEEQRFVSGINCMAQTALDEMNTVKRFYHKTDGKACAHAVQAFRPGEVTPELAHQIGIELASKLWGDRFQVVVATHLDRAHIHNHFIINYVSFADGKRFHLCNERWYEMVAESDRLCRAYDLSVIERGKDGKGIGIHPDTADRLGASKRPSNRQTCRNDVDAAILASRNMDDFFRFLQGRGYTFRTGNLKYFTLRAPGAERSTRLEKAFGDSYSLAGIEQRIRAQATSGLPDAEATAHIRDAQRETSAPAQETRKPARSVVRSRPRRGVYHPTAPKSYFTRLYLYYCYLFGMFPRQRGRQRYNRQAVTQMRSLSAETRLLHTQHIETPAQLAAYRQAQMEAVQRLSSERKQLYNRLRTAAPEDAELIQSQIRELSKALKCAKEQVRLCEDIQARVLRAEQGKTEPTEKEPAEQEEQAKQNKQQSKEEKQWIQA